MELPESLRFMSRDEGETPEAVRARRKLEVALGYRRNHK
jgi:hypothetical protein